jgi:hypothetical protein
MLEGHFLLKSYICCCSFYVRLCIMFILNIISNIILYILLALNYHHHHWDWEFTVGGEIDARPDPARGPRKDIYQRIFISYIPETYRFKIIDLRSENVRPSAVQWQLLHVERDDQVIRHNNNKTSETKEKSIRKAFLFKTLVKNCSVEKYLFCFAGSVLFSLLCVYYFCTIFVIHQKNWLQYHPLGFSSLLHSAIAIYTLE